jgi:hypothetical protein
MMKVEARDERVDWRVAISLFSANFFLTPTGNSSTPGKLYIKHHPPLIMATRLWTCRKCLRNASLSYTPSRSVADRYLQHQIAAQWEWKDKAAEIEKGLRKGMLSILEERGYIHQIAGYV